MKILITGGASNIGYSVGLKLAKLQHKVYLTVHHEYEIAPVQEKIDKLNLDITCFKLDITNELDRKKIYDLDIDCLINNAAVGVGGSLLEIPMADLKQNFEVNVFSNLKFSQMYAADLFLKKRKGKIIFMSSLAGILPISFLGSYCMTKSSIIMMASVLRKEIRLISNNIQIKLIEPGIYNTGFNDYMIENKLAKKTKYFQDIESITMKQKKLFSLIGKDNLDSISNKIVQAVLSDSTKFIYKAPFSQAFLAKLYMILFQ